MAEKKLTTTEKAKLLSISTVLLKTTTSKQLLHSIYKTIQAIFPFDNAGLFVIDENRDVFWEILEEGILEGGIQDELANHDLLGPFPFSGNHPDAWIYVNDVTIYEVNKQAVVYPNPQWAIMQEHGLKELIAAPLMVNGSKIGFLCFNSKVQGFYTEKDFPFFKAISEQLALVVQKIITNERLVAERTFKETLLNISEVIATIENRQELFTLIFDKINTVIPLDDVGLVVLDESGEKWKDLAVSDNYNLTTSNQELESLGYDKYLEKDSLLEFCMNNTAILKLKDAVTKFPDNLFMPIMLNQGFKEMMVTPLQVSNKVIGIIAIDSYTENQYSPSHFPLFKAIADLLAVAVKNVMDSEKLIKRQKRIEDLLKISTAASNIQNRKELLKVIFDTIKPVFPFDGAGLFIIDAKKNEHYEILDDIDILGELDTLQVSLINAELLGKFQHNGSAVDMLSRGKNPHLFHIPTDKVKWPHPQFDLMLKEGLRQIIGIGLQSGGKTFGMFCFNAKKEDFYSEEDFSFFKAISEQVALAVKNVLANEEVLSEKIKVENLLMVSEAMASIKSSSRLIETIFNDIKAVFPFDDVGLFAYDIDNQKERDLMIDEEYGSPATSEIKKAGITGWLPLTDASIYFAKNGPLVMDVQQLFDKWKHPHFEIILKEGYRQIIGGPLKNGDELIGMLCFWRKHKDGFSDADVSFFKSIANQVSVALSNVLAKEEVQRLSEELRLERDYLIEEVKAEHNFEEIIGNSPILKTVFKNIDIVANTDVSVLIEGETGTGKELTARAIHNRSDRKRKPIIKVNCATLPKELVESELFGHEKGSFTGAFERRIGKFELANNGTLFLDEIGELPLELQPKLLRALQEKEIERIGGKELIKTNVRIIAATNRDLEEECEKGNFRLDLYYRLNVFPLKMPSLRERIEDIPLLATFFAQKFCAKLNVPFMGIKEKAMQELLQYDWPGNIRELQNLVEQATILNQGKALSWARELVPVKRSTTRKNKENAIAESSVPEFDLEKIKAEQNRIERDKLLDVLKKTNWRIRGDKGAAKLLNIKPTTLEYRLKKLGLK